MSEIMSELDRSIIEAAKAFVEAYDEASATLYVTGRTNEAEVMTMLEKQHALAAAVHLRFAN